MGNSFRLGAAYLRRRPGALSEEGQVVILRSYGALGAGSPVPRSIYPDKQVEPGLKPQHFVSCRSTLGYQTDIASLHVLVCSAAAQIPLWVIHASCQHHVTSILASFEMFETKT